VKSKLVIDLASLPEDGKGFAGELDPAIYDLPEGDAVPVGPLVYELTVRRFESELLLTGLLESAFEFTCVRTLHPFVQTICLEDAAISVEIGSQVEIDVTEALREEVLINFPANPRCEDGDEPGECKIDPRYFVVDKTAEGNLDCPPRAEGDDRWSALDQIKDLTDQP
jgi:uncharacterized metal-binding protein YceD (DUF177 family)